MSQRPKPGAKLTASSVNYKGTSLKKKEKKIPDRRESWSMIDPSALTSLHPQSADSIDFGSEKNHELNAHIVQGLTES